MSKQEKTLLGSLNHRDHDAGMTRSDKQKRALKGAALATATVGLAGGLVYAGAASNSGEAHAGASNDTPVTCEVVVKPGDTLSGLSDEFQVGQSHVKVYHPNSITPERKPAYEMQPGDVAVTTLGATACYGMGGMPGDPEHPNVIIE